MARLIDADALLKEYDRVHVGPPGGARKLIEEAPTVDGWVSVKDRLPENANKPGAFCPRYLVMTKYGVTEGWYNPDKGCWYVLLWFMFRYVEEDINLERADKPGVASNVEVTYWMPFPEPPEE